MRHAPPDRVVIAWISIAVFGVVVAVSILLALALRRVARALFPSLFKPKKPAANLSPNPPAWAPLVWLVLVAGFAVLFFFMKPTRGKPNGVPRPITWAWVLVPTGIGLAYAGLVAFRKLRDYDASLHRAQKRAAAGDLDGAIENLREQIEALPTQNRVNALGILLFQRNQWDEAAALFRKAEELGEHKGVCRMNLGLALLQAGKPEEALPVLQEASRTGPQNPVMECMVSLHTANALAELGRWDEARAHWHTSQTAGRSLAKAHREAFGKELEKCRLKLEEGLPAKPKLEGLEEL
jgi:Flp pilus assembly protein TadD